MMTKPTIQAPAFKKYAYTAFCIFLSVNGLSVIDYTVFTQGFVDIKASWIKQITQKCGIAALEGGFFERSLKDLGQVNACIGGYFGILL